VCVFVFVFILQGYTKMGYAGNSEPSYIIPTCIAVADDKGTTLTKKGRIDDLDFYIGDEAIGQKQYSVSYPIRHGQVRCVFLGLFNLSSGYAATI
jgi:actin-related protein